MIVLFFGIRNFYAIVYAEDVVMEIYTGKGELLKARQFRELCRYYNAEKKWLQRLEEQRSAGNDSVHLTNKCMYLRKNIEKVDRGIQKMSDLFGEEAGQMLRRKYIGKEDIRDLSDACGVSVRTMQKRMSDWLQEIDL